MFKYAERKSTRFKHVENKQERNFIPQCFCVFFFSGTSSLFIREPKQSSLADDSADCKPNHLGTDA